jgi:glutamate formiminotransferase/formiminotetrahydrofolate cyclodeaminase
MAAGLAGMVAQMSRGKKAWLQYETQLSQAIARLALIREELKSAIDADAEAYSVVMKAYKAAKDAPGADRAIVGALQLAASVPMSVAERAAEVERIATGLRPITNPRMSSDLTTAVALANAAMEGALANVEVNLESMNAETPEDAAFVTETRTRASALKAQA